MRDGEAGSGNDEARDIEKQHGGRELGEGIKSMFNLSHRFNLTAEIVSSHQLEGSHSKKGSHMNPPHIYTHTRTPNN